MLQNGIALSFGGYLHHLPNERSSRLLADGGCAFAIMTTYAEYSECMEVLSGSTRTPFLKMDLLISIASRAMTNGGNTCPLSYRRVRRSNENHHHHQQGWHSYPEVEGVGDADDEVGKNTNL